MNETKLSGESLDILSENISKLKELFPEIVTEDKIDFDKFKEVFGNYVEDSTERYNFTWKGKSAALRLAQTPSMGTLRPCKEDSKNWDTTENVYIEGDNLEVLKLLQKSYYSKIKMIYIDPPYNTGKEFVYPDNFKDNLKNYLEITGQVDSEGIKISTNTDSSGRYHTNWLNMMYPRLRLARNLLTDDGVIFISIDENELSNLKKICENIFGEENYITDLIWKSKSGGANDSKFFAVDHEYIVCCAKNASYFKIKNDPEAKVSTSYNYKDEKGEYALDRLDKQSIRYSNSLDYEIIGPDGKKYSPKHKDPKNPNATWRWGKETVKKRFDELVFKDGNVYTKNYKKKGAIPRTLLIEERFGRTRTGKTDFFDLFSINAFSSPKPIKILRFLTMISTDNDDIILDFFSGSATMAHAVMKLNSEDNGNRKFVMVQLPELTTKKDDAYKSGYKNICEIGKERIRRAGDKIVSEMNQKGQTSLDSKSKTDLDIGFKVFKLDSSNLAKWDPEYDNLEQTLLDSVKNLVPGRNELDLVYEIMLKYGIDLTLPIEEYPIQEKKFYSIGFGALIICLDDDLTSNLASEIIKLKDNLSPEVMRVVFKDNGFASDSDKTNIKETLKTNGIEEFVTI